MPKISTNLLFFIFFYIFLIFFFIHFKIFCIIVLCYISIFVYENKYINFVFTLRDLNCLLLYLSSLPQMRVRFRCQNLYNTFIVHTCISTCLKVSVQKVVALGDHFSTLCQEGRGCFSWKQTFFFHY